MRGVAAFARGCRRQRIGPRRRTVGIDAGALPGRVILRDQGCDRRIDEGGIAEITRTVGIAALYRFDHDMQRRRGALLHLTHRKPFEDVQRLQQHDAAGRRLRHREDIISAIAAAHRGADDSVVGLEILRCHNAAGVPNCGGQFLRDRSLIKSAPSPYCDRREGRRQIGLNKRVSFAQRRAVDAGKYFCRRRPARQPPIPVRQGVGIVIGEDNAVARQIDRRLQQIRKRKLARAIFLQRQR